MPKILRKKILARELDQAFTNTQVEVTWTANMVNGAILDASGAQIASGAAATAAFVINDYSLGDNGMIVPAVGDVVQVNAVTFAAKVYAKHCMFTDRAATIADNATATVFATKQIELV